jgi:hypothetical protein
MRELWNEIQAAASTVRVLFADDLERRTALFKQLHITADMGLRGNEFSLATAIDNLKQNKESIALEFPSVRSRIWRSYSIYVLISALTLAPFGAFIYFAASRGLFGLPVPVAGNFDFVIVTIIAVLWIPFGLAVGIFLEFIFRIGDDTSYEKLIAISPGRWKPSHHFVNSLITAYSFAGIMAIGAFQVGIANILLNDFATNKPYLAIAVGFVAGLAYPYMRDIIYQFQPTRREN